MGGATVPLFLLMLAAPGEAEKTAGEGASPESGAGTRASPPSGRIGFASRPTSPPVSCDAYVRAQRARPSAGCPFCR